MTKALALGPGDAIRKLGRSSSCMIKTAPLPEQYHMIQEALSKGSEDFLLVGAPFRAKESNKKLRPNFEYEKPLTK